MSNRLSKENSLYLLQHQSNPVDWYPWKQEAFQAAKQENKLIVVSIGYSSCHWCHVMERESFMQQDVAEVMNANFVSIKVDREERPDIDQIYMLAVQLMTGQGGWPLNMVCLPDGRPVYGGTYFPKEDWKNILLQLAEKWKNEPELLYDYAQRLTGGIQQAENFPVQRIPPSYSKEDIEKIVIPWKERFDEAEGGYHRAPKFPLPNNWSFLLQYGIAMEDEEAVSQVHLTLEKMANGGIYDQVGGGFSRYSVDRFWHIPHFEKMLYDNALLVSLYTQAYQHRPKPIYKKIVSETLAWVKREMTGSDGGFYSAIDADSEGVEGKFYTFSWEEFHEALGEYAPVFAPYFRITKEGNWAEMKTNVLWADTTSDILSEKFNGDEKKFNSAMSAVRQKLFQFREKRVHPVLDKKVLLSWNAMMSVAYLDAYRVFGVDEYLKAAEENMRFIEQHLQAPEGYLLRFKAPEHQQVPAFLDDYAFYISSLIAFYEVTFEEKWVMQAKKWAEYAIDHFYEEGATAFYYSSVHAEPLIARKFEIMDDVIPSSNSVLIRQLGKLGLIFDEPRFTDLVNQLLANVFPQVQAYGSSFSNWAIYLLEEIVGRYEIVISGLDFQDLRSQIDKFYLPNKTLMGGVKGSLPLVKGRVGELNRIYLCQNKTCSLPVSTVNELKKLIFKPE